MGFAGHQMFCVGEGGVVSFLRVFSLCDVRVACLGFGLCSLLSRFESGAGLLDPPSSMQLMSSGWGSLVFNFAVWLGWVFCLCSIDGCVLCLFVVCV